MFRLARTGIFLLACVSVACTVAGAGERGEMTVVEYNSALVQPAGHYGVGQAASAAEIAGWDIDIRPDGVGLPDGGATPEDGEMLYEEQCASCHGSFGEGVDRYPVLAGGEGTLTEPRPEKTVGSFWPYASTLWDYIHRAMPFAMPESLDDEEVYALTAYVLYLNDLIEYDFELNQGNLASIEMPNEDGFFLDDRPDVINRPCMKNCKDPASIRITSETELPAEVEASVVAALDAAPPAGESVYQRACAVCHDSGIGEAPVPGDKLAWSARLAKGRDTLLISALAGIGIMPPKGGMSQLTDEEVAAAVDFIISHKAK